MSDGNRDEILSEFTGVTGVAEDRAKFYLESANWNLQVCCRNVCRQSEREIASQCEHCDCHRNQTIDYRQCFIEIFHLIFILNMAIMFWLHIFCISVGIVQFL